MLNNYKYNEISYSKIDKFLKKLLRNYRKEKKILTLPNTEYWDKYLRSVLKNVK